MKHYTSYFEADDRGWWEAVCRCGAQLGQFPNAEDACDALMQHAYDAGVEAAKDEAEGDE